MRRPLLFLGVAALLLTAGCVSAPTSAPGTGTETASSACTATPSYNVSVTPSKPGDLTADAAVDAASAYESQYRKAWLTDRERLSYYNFLPHETSTERTNDGYRVTLPYNVDYGTTGGPNGTALHAKRPFTAHFTVTERRLVREGTTVACW